MQMSPLQQVVATPALLLRESQSLAHSAQLHPVLEMRRTFARSARLNVHLRGQRGPKIECHVLDAYCAASALNKDTYTLYTHTRTPTSVDIR